MKEDGCVFKQTKEQNYFWESVWIMYKENKQ